MNGTAMITRPQTPALAVSTIDDALKLGETLWKSGNFPDVRTAAAAVVKILAGQEMGFGPMASMADIHFIEGKPSVGAHLRAAAIRRRNVPYDYDVVQSDATACVLEFWEETGVQNGTTRKGRPGWSSRGKVEYTMAEVVAAGFHLANDGKVKKNWRSSPADMLFARCLSRGYRRHCPDLTGGVLAYDPDELADAGTPVPQISVTPVAVSPEPVQDAVIVPPATASPPSLPAPAAPPLAPPGDGPHTPDQAARLNELATALNVTPEVLAQRLREMNMPPDWHDLTQAQAAKVIGLMEARLADRKKAKAKVGA